jgi:CRP/FNR family cyclic AMP-dependent transcriptional regulator
VKPDHFLAGLAQADRDDLYALGRTRRWPPGAELFAEGDRPGAVVILLKGRVKVYSLTEPGTEVVLAIRGPGALLGELSAVDGAPRAASVLALERLEALVVPLPAFTGFLKSHPGAASELLKTVVARLRDADRKRVEFGAYDAVGRVALRLVELAERFGAKADDRIRINLPFTQGELAGWIGASREAVAKALRSLREQGMIETRRKTVSVLDLERLRARAR